MKIFFGEDLFTIMMRMIRTVIIMLISFLKPEFFPRSMNTHAHTASDDGLQLL